MMSEVCRGDVRGALRRRQGIHVVATSPPGWGPALLMSEAQRRVVMSQLCRGDVRAVPEPCQSGFYIVAVVLVMSQLGYAVIVLQ